MTPAPMMAANAPAMGGKGGGNVQAVPMGMGPQNALTAQPATPSTGQPNVFQQASNAYAQALQGTTAAGMAQPMNVSAQNVGTQFGYNPQNVQVGSVGTQFGYDPANVGAATVGTQFGYGPQNVQAGSAVGGINTYMNPFTQQVIDTSMADLERQRLMQQNQLGAQATAARAFGGSRQGIAEAETNRAFAQQGGQLAAQLRQQGFQTALGASQQDVANKMQAALANQAVGARAAEFGQQTGLQAQGMNQQAAMQAALANQAAQAQAAQFGQQLGFQGQQANQQAAMQAALANQAAQAQAAQFGQSTGLQAQGMNQQAAMQAALANQAAQAQAAQLGLSAAGQMGNLANLGFGFGTQLNQQQAQQGQMVQALQQALIDAAKGQYAGFTGAPAASIQLPLAAVGASNMGQQTQTTSGKPGLFDYLTLGATALGGLCWVAREVYGEDDPRWVQFRTWLLTDAPATFRRAYIRHGEAFAKVVKRLPVLKRVLRPLMDMARQRAGFEV